MNINQEAPSFFKRECETSEGQELRALIALHSCAMEAKSEDGRPALEAVMPHVTLRLAEALSKRDALMAAFGYMASLEMNKKGLTERGTGEEYLWPKLIERSHVMTFHRIATAKKYVPFRHNAFSASGGYGTALA